MGRQPGHWGASDFSGRKPLKRKPLNYRSVPGDPSQNWTKTQHNHTQDLSSGSTALVLSTGSVSLTF